MATFPESSWQTILTVFTQLGLATPDLGAAVVPTDDSVVWQCPPDGEAERPAREQGAPGAQPGPLVHVARAAPAAAEPESSRAGDFDGHDGAGPAPPVRRRRRHMLRGRYLFPACGPGLGMTRREVLVLNPSRVLRSTMNSMISLPQGVCSI